MINYRVILSMTFWRADQDSDTSPGLTIGGCFTTTDCRAASALGVVAIVARQAAAKAKLIAVLMIITVALLRSSGPIAV
jgi:hypothetical protein